MSKDKQEGKGEAMKEELIRLYEEFEVAQREFLLTHPTHSSVSHTISYFIYWLKTGKLCEESK